jgi:hypothetical protein
MYARTVQDHYNEIQRWVNMQIPVSFISRYLKKNMRFHEIFNYDQTYVQAYHINFVSPQLQK